MIVNEKNKKAAYAAFCSNEKMNVLQFFFGNRLNQTTYRRMRYVEITPRTNPQSREMENPPSTFSTKPAFRVMKFIESVSERIESPTLAVGGGIVATSGRISRLRPHSKTSAVVHETSPRLVLLGVECVGFHGERCGAAGTRQQQSTQEQRTHTQPMLFHDFSNLRKPRTPRGTVPLASLLLYRQSQGESSSFSEIIENFWLWDGEFSDR